MMTTKRQCRRLKLQTEFASREGAEGADSGGLDACMWDAL